MADRKRERPAKAGGNQERDTKGRFAKGRSGNPAGKPKGTRHRATAAASALLEGEAEALTRKAIELALGGDAVALRLCLERIAPPAKERPLSVDLPPVTDGASAIAAHGAIIAAVAAGALTPGEADALGRLVDRHRQALVEAQEAGDAGAPPPSIRVKVVDARRRPKSEAETQ